MNTENEAATSLYVLSVFVVMAGCLAAFFSSNIPLYSATMIGLIVLFVIGAIYPLVAFRPDKNLKLYLIAWVNGIIVYVLMRHNLSDFTLWVGDASSYLWDGIHSIEKHEPSGFFPPLSSAISSVGYFAFGITNIPIASIIFGVASVVLIFTLFQQAEFDWWQAWLSAMVFGLLPLSIWFTKTTFSEPIWQIIVIGSIVAVSGYATQREYRSVSTVAYILVLALCLIMAPWARGTAPFLLAVMLPSIFLFNKNNWLLPPAILFLVVPFFLVSFYFSLHVREPYLIGWQYTKVLKSATPVLIFAIVSGLVALMVALVFLIRRMNYSTRAVRTILIIFALLAKYSSATYFAIKYGREITKYIYGKELSFFLQSFSGFAIPLVLFGSLIVLKRSIVSGGVWLAILLTYLFFSIPFNLMGIDATRAHEMAFYWSRYYYSELYFVHFVFIAISLSWIVKLISAYFGRNGVSPIIIRVIFTISLLSACSWGNIGFVYKNSYLEGSAGFVQWLMKYKSGNSVALIFDKEIRYGGYNGSVLFSQLNRSGMPVEVSGDFNSTTTSQRLRELTKNNEVVVFCFNVPSCVHGFKHNEIGRYADVITWQKHLPPHPRNHIKTLSLDVVAYQLEQEWALLSTMDVNQSNENRIKEMGILNEGWHNIEYSGVWSYSTSNLLIPVPDECIYESKCLLEISFSVFNASPSSPKEVLVEIEGEQFGKWLISSNKIVTRQVPISINNTSKNSNRVSISIVVPEAISPSELGVGSDSRVLGISLKKLGLIENDTVK